MKITLGDVFCVMGLMLMVLMFIGFCMTMILKDNTKPRVDVTAIAMAVQSEATALTRLEKQLWKHEGFRSRVYLDPAGTNFVVGVGRNIQDKGLSKDEALYLLRNDIRECRADLRTIFLDFDGLSEDRRMVLIDMRFCHGKNGFREYKDMIQAVKDKDYTLAAHEMMDSKWYSQVGRRGERLRDMMLGVKNDNRLWIVLFKWRYIDTLGSG